MVNRLHTQDFRFYIGGVCLVENTIMNIVGIDTISDSVILQKLNRQSQGLKYKSDSVRPILRRFESLNRHEVEGLNRLWPLERINRTTFESIVLDAVIIDYLTRLNVDVFGWIDQDLAIDAAYYSENKK